MDGILSEKTHRAAKAYFCTCCERLIMTGEEYTRAFWRPDWQHSGDKPIDAKFCTHCHTPPAKLTTPPTGPDGYDYIRRHYGVPVKVGQQIEVDGTAATVARPGNLGQYVYFMAEGDKRSHTAHPTWETVYYNEDGSIAADYRKRPQEATA